MGTNQAERLGQLVVARRIQLGMRTSVALAEAAGLTPRVISDLESGRRSNFSASTKAQIEAALKWHTGSIDDALGGRHPRPIREGRQVELFPQEDPDGDDWPSEESRIRKINEERLQQYSGNAEISAQMIDTVLSLPVDFTPDERARLQDIRRDIQRLPEVLAPWIGTPMGTRQYIEQMSSLMKESRDILRRAADEKYGQGRDEGDANVASLADRRRPVPPPPDIDDLDVAASRREKQSDGERDDDE